MKQIKISSITIFYYIIGWIMAVCFYQCSKDPPIPLHGECWLPTPEGPTFANVPIYRTPGIGYIAPCFNPLNKNEIIYVKVYYSKKLELVKYNITTKSATVLLTGSIGGHPNYGRNGWILFNHGDNKVWKIKDSGDSLMQLTNWDGFDAVWDPTGTKFAYRGWNYSFIAKADGTITDTLYYPIKAGTWSPDGTKIAAVKRNIYGYIDVTTKQFHPVAALPLEFGMALNSIDWMPDSQTMIWTSWGGTTPEGEGGVFKTDIKTGKTIQLRKGCVTRTYSFLSVSNDGSKIIVQREDLKPLAKDTIWMESNLYIMDSDGKNETKLELP